MHPFLKKANLSPPHPAGNKKPPWGKQSFRSEVIIFNAGAFMRLGDAEGHREQVVMKILWYTRHILLKPSLTFHFSIALLFIMKTDCKGYSVTFDRCNLNRLIFQNIFVLLESSHNPRPWSYVYPV